MAWKLHLPRGRALELSSQPRVMGIVNVTPDSFSDGGRWLAPERAIEHGLSLLEDGADILDIGAESTRPGGGIYGAGAREVPSDEELERLIPVLEGLRRQTDAPLSVDTRKGRVAREALAAGADLINDVGGLADPELIRAVAESGCPVIVMHSRGALGSMQHHIQFENVVEEVAEELAAAGRRGRAGGISEEQMVYDPGIGFGKTAAGNLELLGNLKPLRELERPILIGASRKGFIAQFAPAPPDQRLGGSLAAAAWAAHQGASVLRVHDVAPTAQFLEVWNAIHLRCGPPDE